MLASALKLFSAARLGHAARQAMHRLCVQAAVYAIVALLFVGGIVFALIAAYFWLVTFFAPFEAAGIIAAVLIASGSAVLATRLLITRRNQATQPQFVQDPGAAISRTAADVTESLGPAQVISIALLAGLAAGRSINKS